MKTSGRGREGGGRGEEWEEAARVAFLLGLDLGVIAEVLARRKGHRCGACLAQEDADVLEPVLLGEVHVLRL